jgi:hypothetical protein
MLLPRFPGVLPQWPSRTQVRSPDVISLPRVVVPARVFSTEWVWDAAPTPEEQAGLALAAKRERLEKMAAPPQAASDGRE